MSSESENELQLSANIEEEALEKFLVGFGLPPKNLPKSGEIIPQSEITKVVLQEFFDIRPTCSNVNQAVNEVAKKTGTSYTKVWAILSKSSAQTEAKRQREEYADAIYSQKLPLAKSIVGKSLVEVDNFLTTFKPTTIQEAKDLVRMATDMTTLLRLELGQSTQQIEIIHKTHKDITVVLEELKATDPFMDYGDDK